MIKTASGCIDCGYAAHAAALQFDHIDNNKKANVSDLIRSDYGWETIKKEIDKCVVRCANCHAIVTAERRHAEVVTAQRRLDTQAMDPYPSNAQKTPIDSMSSSTQLPGGASERSHE